MTVTIETQTVLDALGHGVLIFSSDGKLIQHNIMAGTILGTDLNVIKSEGWVMATELFDIGLQSVDLRMETVKEMAMKSERPIRFKIYRSGAYIPCWAAAVNTTSGEVMTMLTLDSTDWEIVSNVIDRFRNEMRETVESTVGHINLINRTLKGKNDDDATLKIAKRIGGFTRLIEIHMSRGGRLMSMLDRLQDIRTGRIRDRVRDTRKKINLEDFIEDFMESLDEVQLLDPESETHDYRARVRMDLESDLNINAAAYYLNFALREILRNAIMYSLIGTPITIRAHQKTNHVQIDFIDEGYGVRQKEWERVFEPFVRARQPQIISEFGYGLALHLCKNEIEAMNGRLWFTSEENVGTTFSIMLPAWKDQPVDSASSSA